MDGFTHSGLVVDTGTVLGDSLSVGLHVSLLKVVGESLQVLVIWQQGLGLSTCKSVHPSSLILTVEVVVPDTNEGKDDWQVLLELGRGKVLVHLVSTGKQLGKVFVTDGKGDGETDGGPKGVSTSDPVPELEHVGLVDSESGDGLGVGREGDKVLGDVGLL